MKIRIDDDELYPYFYIPDETDTCYGYGKEVEVDVSTVKRWKKISKAFDKMQREMEETIKCQKS